MLAFYHFCDSFGFTSSIDCNNAISCIGSIDSIDSFDSIDSIDSLDCVGYLIINARSLLSQFEDCLLDHFFATLLEALLQG